MTPEDVSDGEAVSPEPPEQTESLFAQAEPHEQSETPFTESAGEPDAVNSQIADAITQALKTVLDSGPTVAGGSFAQVAAQASGLAMLNAVSAQQNAQIAANAATLRIVAQLLSPPNATGESAS